MAINQRSEFKICIHLRYIPAIILNSDVVSCVTTNRFNVAVKKIASVSSPSLRALESNLLTQHLPAVRGFNENHDR